MLPNGIEGHNKYLSKVTFWYQFMWILVPPVDRSYNVFSSDISHLCTLLVKRLSSSQFSNFQWKSCDVFLYSGRKTENTQTVMVEMNSWKQTIKQLISSTFHEKLEKCEFSRKLLTRSVKKDFEMWFQIKLSMQLDQM